MMKRILAAVMALTLMLAGTGAFAMYIQCEEGVLELEAVSFEDGAEVSVKAPELQLLGLDEDGKYLVYANQSFYRVEADFLNGALSSRGMDMSVSLPTLSDLEPMGRGAQGESVVPIQEVLKASGYLSGAVDGDFGGATERAVSAFQASLGMEQTGVLEPIQQMLLLSMIAEPVTLGPDLRAQYEAIAERTGMDVDVILENGLSFDYDDMTGNGFISNGNTTTVELSGDSDIERNTLTVRFGLRVTEDEQRAVSVVPAALVSCLCVRRPVLTEVIVKSGEYRGTAPVEELTATLEGVNSLESGVVALNERMISALANAAEAGELKVRLTGRYNTFDIEVAPENLAAVAKIGQVAQEMFG